MIYQYVASDEKGAVVKGRLTAANDAAANEVLGYAGYRTISLKPYTPFVSSDRLSAFVFTVKKAEIILLYHQLAMLLESGTNIATSLELLQQQVSNRALKKVLGEVVSGIRAGSQLSAVLSRHPKVFSPIYCRLLGVGEQSGNLETMLIQVADYMEKEDATAKETKSALMMPLITFVITVGVILLLVTFILPSFTSLYSSLGVEIPVMVKLLMTGSSYAQSYGHYLLFAVFIVGGLTLRYIKTPGGRYKLDKLILSLPIVGRVRHLSELARCCRCMSLLFRAGLPLTEVMPMVVQGSGNKAIAKALTDVEHDMVKGEGLSGPMAKNELFLPMMVQMIKVGEEAGNLETTLLSVARSYEVEAEDKMRSLIGLIQPAMTIVIGLVIGVMAMSLFSAIYSMFGQSGL